jgi:limonene 1,2-monooxygenase
MTRGRAVFGVGPGALPSDAIMIGVPVTELRRRMEESLDAIIELFGGGTVTRRTDWFELQKARLSVGCFSKPMMELAVTTIRSPAGVVAAARHGLGLLTLGPMNDAVLDHHAANWQIYEQECQKHAHVADRRKWRITLMMHIAESREKAMADAAWGFREFNNYSHDVIPAPPAIPRDTADVVGAALEKQVAIIGTPDDAIREIERVRQKLGGFGAVLLFGNDLAPWPAQCRSFELVAEFVKPHFTRANALRQASYDATARVIGAFRQAAIEASNAATELYKRK